MDTVQFKISTIMASNQDTLLTKVLLITKDISMHQTENIFLPYLPFISVIVGAFLAFFTQYLIKCFEQRQQNKRDISLTKYSLIKNVNLLHFYLRDLAYLKVDTNLQNYYAETETDEYSQKKAQDEAYSNYKHISDKEEKISLIYSELFSDIIKYFKLTKKEIPQDTATYFEDLRTHLLTLEIANEIPTDALNVGEFTKTEISSLTKIYIDKLLKIKSIIHDLK